MVGGPLGNVEDWKQKMDILSVRSPIGVAAPVGAADPASLFAAAHLNVFEYSAGRPSGQGEPAAEVLTPPSGFWHGRSSSDDIATASQTVGTSTSWPHR